MEVYVAQLFFCHNRTIITPTGNGEDGGMTSMEFCANRRAVPPDRREPSVSRRIFYCWGGHRISAIPSGESDTIYGKSRYFFTLFW